MTLGDADTEFEDSALFDGGVDDNEDGLQPYDEADEEYGDARNITANATLPLVTAGVAVVAVVFAPWSTLSSMVAVAAILFLLFLRFRS